MHSDILISKASLADAVTILALQKAAFLTEAELYDDFDIQPLTETLTDMEEAFSRQTILKAVTNGMIVGAIRGSQTNDTCYPARLVVQPEFRNKGLGYRLMQELEAQFPNARKFEIFTGHKSDQNLHLYKKLEYIPFKTEKIHSRLSFVHLEKRVRDDATE